MEVLELIPCCCACIDILNEDYNLESTLKDLDDNTKSLVVLRDNVQRQLGSSPAGRETSSRAAEEWLDKVANVEKRVDSTREKVAARPKGRARSCYSESKWRSKVSNEVMVSLEEIKRLHKDGRFENLFSTTKA